MEFPLHIAQPTAVKKVYYIDIPSRPSSSSPQKGEKRKSFSPYYYAYCSTPTYGPYSSTVYRSTSRCWFGHFPPCPKTLPLSLFLLHRRAWMDWVCTLTSTENGLTLSQTEFGSLKSHIWLF